jgi:small GTP-binding protein
MIDSEIQKEFNAYYAHLDEILRKVDSLQSKIKGEVSDSKSLPEHSIVEDLNENIIQIRTNIDKLNVKLNVIVLGKFNSGKSTFINSLLNRRVAVVDELEMTYVLSHITFGKELAIIKYKDGSDEEYEPIQLNALLLKNRSNREFREKIDSVEFRYPFKELENINLWDTPGLGSLTVENKETTLGIMEESDVVLWVLDVANIGDADDKAYLERITKLNKPVICIINKCDMLDDPEGSTQRIYDFIEDVYPNCFAKVFLCSALNAPKAKDNYDSDFSGIDTIKKFLEENVFAKKRELIINGAMNTAKSIMQNIENILLSFKQRILEKIDNYTRFGSELNKRVNEIIPLIKKEIDSFVESNLFEPELSQLQNEIQNGMYQEEGALKKRISGLINEKTIESYASNLRLFVKGRLQGQWSTAVVKSSNIIESETKDFFIAQNDLVYNSKPIKIDVDEVFVGVTASLALGAGSLTAVGSMAAGKSVLASLAGGTAVAGIAVAAGYVLVHGFMNTLDKNKYVREALSKEVKKLKNEFYDSIVRGQIYTELEDIEGKIKSKVMLSAEEKVFAYGSLADNKFIIREIDTFLQFQYKVVQSIENLCEKIAGLEPLFYKKVAREDFIIYRSNPNPGIDQLIKVVSNAAQYIYIVDPYFQEKSLNWLKHINTYIPIKILAYYIDQEIDLHQTFLTKLKELRKERKSSILVRLIKYKDRKGTPLHDRFIFSGEWGVQLGNGLDAIGKQDISVTFLGDFKVFKENYFDKYWNANIIKFEEGERQIVRCDI